MGERVLVAMSGGVDSSVAAALLVEQGYEVMGVTMQVWPDLSPAEEARRGGCCSISAVNDARHVADLLDIPYYVLNMQETFERSVIDYFIDEYAAGRTPNPCVACNRHVKFDALLRKARELGCRYVATGHYARVEQDPETGRYLLYNSADAGKDQTYALCQLTQDQLRHILFPVGGYTKPEVRRLAFQRGLPTAAKPDSQEICFVLDNDYGAFIESRAPHTVQPGPIYDTAGNRLGTHRGLPHYTVGQRRGLGITAGRPLYVVALKPEENALIVGTADQVQSAGLVAEGVNWIPYDRPPGPVTAQVKIRYRAEGAPAVIYPQPDGTAVVAFQEPQRAVTPGQTAAFYDGDLVLGGGTIRRALTLSELQRRAYARDDFGTTI
ncbi:MAG TPA: tRNA 2-thiouridine(34) synthase MnmA [Sphingobacteriaceae bacterium]|nr:tRNA 2-thiouridine(34) synthase MnmA [Sphingobacteriaceae bacterium]